MQNRSRDSHENKRCSTKEHFDDVASNKLKDNPSVLPRGYFQKRSGDRGPVMCHSWVPLTQTHQATISVEPGGPEREETDRLLRSKCSLTSASVRCLFYVNVAIECCFGCVYVMLLMSTVKRSIFEYFYIFCLQSNRTDTKRLTSVVNVFALLTDIL